MSSTSSVDVTPFERHLSEVNRLTYDIVKSYFGDACAMTCVNVARYQPIAYVQLRRCTNLPMRILRSALAVLVQHDIVTFKAKLGSSLAMYECDTMQVLRWQRAAVYVQYVRQQLGPVAAAVYTDVLRHGKVHAGTCVRRVVVQEVDYNEKQLRNVFEGLVDARYIARAPMQYAENADDTCPVREAHKERFTPPTSDDFELADAKQKANVTTDRRRRAGSTDEAQLWRVDYQRIEAQLRDELIVDFVKKTDADEVTVAVLKAALGVAEKMSYSRSAVEINGTNVQRELSRSSSGTDRKPLRNDALDMAFERVPSAILTRAIGDCIRVDYAGAVCAMAVCWKFVIVMRLFLQRAVECALVKARSSDRASRVLSMLRENGAMEVHDVANDALLSQNLANELTWMLCVDGHIAVEALSTRGDYHYSTSTYLFKSTSRLSRCRCREKVVKMTNSVRGRQHAALVAHQHLLKRQAQMQTIMRQIEKSELDAEEKEKQIEEIKDAYTTHAERERLRKLEEHGRMCAAMLLALDQMLFILDMDEKYSASMIVPGGK